MKNNFLIFHRRYIILVFYIITFLSFSLIFAQSSGTTSEDQNTDREIDLVWGVKIPMRDNVELNATIYKPKDMGDPLPVIFTLTPYISDSYHDRAYYFSRNDYIFALVDARGRGSSEGNFNPFIQESRDAYDIIEWLAKQPWSNGKIAMWGGSYAGYDQWAALKGSPPHLMTIVPAASAFPGVDFPIYKNISYPYIIQWLTLTSGVTPNLKLFSESSFWIQKFTELYKSNQPFKDLDKIVGNHSNKLRTWISHPTQDAYWDAMNPTDEEFAKINVPILTITGHYDDDQPGAMEFYKRHMQFASAEARAQHYLIIGPWDHAGTRTPTKEVGGLRFGDASVLDLNNLHKEWYNWILKDGKKPDFLKKRVAYYVVAADEWKYADDLEMISNGKLMLYLNSDGNANDVFHSGILSTSNMSRSPVDRYIYDPIDKRPADLDFEAVENYLTDQRYTLNLFGNGLVYHSQPFENDFEITGKVKFVAWIEMDVPDTDFDASIYEVTSDGTCIYLAGDVLRARYRESLRQEKMVKPGEISRYAFNFTFFSRQIAKGSRLRLVLKCINSIYWQKNYNSGGVVAEETDKDARIAHIRLYHDAEHLSYLEIPIVK